MGITRIAFFVVLLFGGALAAHYEFQILRYLDIDYPAWIEWLVLLPPLLFLVCSLAMQPKIGGVYSCVCSLAVGILAFFIIPFLTYKYAARITHAAMSDSQVTELKELMRGRVFVSRGADSKVILRVAATEKEKVLLWLNNQPEK